jgi:hypothetical protein
MAQGMENAGAQVISVSHDGMHQPFGAMEPSSKFIVWAKYESPMTPEQIDVAIDDELSR